MISCEKLDFNQDFRLRSYGHKVTQTVVNYKTTSYYSIVSLLSFPHTVEL